jgi:glycine betaine/proline transport system substrate-binding protein
MKKHTLKLVGVLALMVMLAGMGTAMASSHMPGKGKSVQPARANWTTGYFLEAIFAQGLEQLGYEVEDPKEFGAPIFYQSVAQGDVDYWANGWFPLHNEFVKGVRNFEEKAAMAGTIAAAGAVQGYLVSKEHVEKYNIKSLEDFKRSEVKKAFDANDDGKADLVACPPGWGCEKVISHHLDAYGLRDHINPIKASYSASMADALARYNDGKPILFYTWTPNWTVYRLKPGKDVMWINVPSIKPTEGQKGLEDAMVASGVTGAVSDPVKMGFAANDIKVVANKEFLDNNPAAAKLFNLIKVGLPAIAAQNNKMFGGEDSQRDIDRHAEEWIKQNQDQWDSWMKKAMAAAK